MAKNVFLDWDTTASNNTDLGGIGIQGTNAVSNFDDALRTTMAQLRTGLDGKVVYASKSANYTALANDNNAVHRYTATATVALTAAATLAANWHYTVVADGAAVTIDPNASETINGLTTMIVPNGSTATIICDGSNFFTVIKPAPWEIITRQTLSAVSSFDLTGLSAFVKIRMTGTIYPSIASTLLLITSSNNGSSYDTGAADYSSHTLSWQAAAFSGLSGNTSSMTISAATSVNANADDAFQFELLFDNFNKTSFLKAKCSANFVGAAGSYITNTAHRRLSTTARNAFRIISGSGTLSGNVTVDGIRG
ncbi:hypothetical protein [Rhizobium laguerreae]|uniref:Uncharacterized protein n=1 Tax=Rhizobium laguerreae TaxID=1076926 RepID=A0A7Y2W922_9HYPH|nr:hypothetical protein [Rhizobium laguerreae]NNH67833.1 hypothetical protein [Rhizobium laguerreae]